MLKFNLSKTSGSKFIQFMDKALCNRKGTFTFKKLNDSFYRGTDPSKNFGTLAKEGIKVILNLKTISTKEVELLAKEAKKNGIEYVNIPLNPFNIKSSISQIIDIIKQTSKDKSLFVHCTYGRDRTGFVTALYRHIQENLKMSEAISDMHKNGFRKTIFRNMENYLKQFEQNKSKNHIIA